MSPYRGSEGSNPSLSAPFTLRFLRTSLTTSAPRLPRSHPHSGRARVRGFALAGAALLGAGCAAERTFTITSEPEGALIRLDDDLVGVTPVTVPFLHYGTRRLTAYLEGHQTRTLIYKAKPPWYGRFPIDIVSEVLLPVGWKDDHPIHFPLQAGIEAAKPPYLRSVLDRAELLRRTGPTGPPVLPPGQLPEAGKRDESAPPLHELEDLAEPGPLP